MGNDDYSEDELATAIATRLEEVRGQLAMKAKLQRVARRATNGHRFAGLIMEEVLEHPHLVEAGLRRIVQESSDWQHMFNFEELRVASTNIQRLIDAVKIYQWDGQIDPGVLQQAEALSEAFGDYLSRAEEQETTVQNLDFHLASILEGVKMKDGTGWQENLRTQLQDVKTQLSKASAGIDESEDSPLVTSRTAAHDVRKQTGRLSQVIEDCHEVLANGPEFYGLSAPKERDRVCVRNLMPLHKALKDLQRGGVDGIGAHLLHLHAMLTKFGYKGVSKFGQGDEEEPVGFDKFKERMRKINITDNTLLEALYKTFAPFSFANLRRLLTSKPFRELAEKTSKPFRELVEQSGMR